MKVRRNVARREYPDAGRQIAVQGAYEISSRDGAAGLETGDKSARMRSRICSSAPERVCLFSRDEPDCLAQLALDSSMPALNLPAVISGSIKTQHKFDVAPRFHRLPGSKVFSPVWHMGHDSKSRTVANLASPFSHLDVDLDLDLNQDHAALAELSHAAVCFLPIAAAIAFAATLEAERYKVAASMLK